MTGPGARVGVALTAARTASWLNRRIRHGQGSVAGGRVLLAVAPKATAWFARGRHVTLVTGTNGKTTTTAMLAAAMTTAYPTVTNSTGANTPPGIATVLAADDGGARPVHAVLETDEGWLAWAIGQTTPACVVLLNLSRDQLHRNPEVQRIAKGWRTVLESVPCVVANADDPAIVLAARAARRQVWVSGGQAWLQDAVVCPQCGRRLVRDGDDWSCECGLARPQPDWVLDGDDVVSGELRLTVHTPLPGRVNRLNAATAIAAAAVAGVPPQDAARAVGTVGDVAGRYDTFDRGDHRVRLLLAKNPAGWLEAVQMIADSPAPIVLGFNAEGVDGRDPSWLYDVDFGPLDGKPAAVIGRRATDLTVRLRMDGLAPHQAATLDDALGRLPAGPVDLIANYSAFQEVWKVLRDG